MDHELNRADDDKAKQEQSVAGEGTQTPTEVGKELSGFSAPDEDEEEQGASKEGAKGDTEEGKGLSAVATVIISLVTAAITSLLSPYLVERWKNADLEHQLDRAKQEKIMATQFDTVERFNAIFWRYRQAAGFVMYDFIHDQPDSKLLERHLKEFEDVSAEANREMPTQAFRARMYFDSLYVDNKLFIVFRDIFVGVDYEISEQLRHDKNTPHPKDDDSQQAWKKIDDDINKSMISGEESLNEVYQQIGKSNIDKTMSPGKELKLYRYDENMPQEPSGH